MKKHLIPYAVTVVIFFVIDILWLGAVAGSLYSDYLAFHLAEEPLWSAAIGFYLIFLVGLFSFAILPSAREGDPWTTASKKGAAFGFFTYMTYDLTNLATLKHWSSTIALIDIVWGTCLNASVAGLSFFFARYWYNRYAG